MTNQLKYTRRNGLGLIGAGSLGLGTAMNGGCIKAGEEQLQAWQGDALGAPASITLYGASERRAKKLFAGALAEIQRLENILSLYKPQSEISRLNQIGVLENASTELIDIVRISRDIASLTNGAFDITVQPLWNVTTRIKQSRLSKASQATLWAQAQALVNYRGVDISGTKISFAKPGMAITLNGLAQGYITDKVCEVLQKGNAKTGLVNIGEHRAFGPRAYKVDIQDPRNVLDVLDTFRLKDQGLATSSPKGGYIRDGVSHIFPTAQGLERPHMSVSVTHKQAVVADALATAFVHMSLSAIRKVSREFGGLSILLVDARGAKIYPY